MVSLEPQGNQPLNSRNFYDQRRQVTFRVGLLCFPMRVNRLRSQTYFFSPLYLFCCFLLFVVVYVCMVSLEPQGNQSLNSRNFYDQRRPVTFRVGLLCFPMRVNRLRSHTPFSILPFLFSLPHTFLFSLLFFCVCVYDFAWSR